MDCFHWLICLSLAINQSGESVQSNLLSSNWKNLESTEQVKEGLREYDRGFNQFCSKSQNRRSPQQKCYKQGRQMLRRWLDGQVDDCLTVPPPSADAMAVSQCRSGADAAFRAIIQQREINREQGTGNREQENPHN